MFVMGKHKAAQLNPDSAILIFDHPYKVSVLVECMYDSVCRFPSNYSAGLNLTLEQFINILEKEKIEMQDNYR